MRRRFVWLVFLVLAFLGLGVRLYHLTAPPLDFHPTRQFHSALIARQLYLRWRPGVLTPQESARRALGNRMARYEPPLFEALVARTCILLGRHLGFHLWVARLYDALFWLWGAWGVFLLARRLLDEAAALVAVGYWWFLPFSIQASRSFQPDPLMTVLVVWSAWAALRWYDQTARNGRKEWWWLAAVVVFGALAGVVKAYGVLFALGIWLALFFARYRWQGWRQPMLWLGTGGLALPVVMVYFFLPRQAVSEGFLHTWTLRMLPLWFSPRLYGGWLQQMTGTMNGGFLLLALLGIVLGSTHLRWLAIGWGGAYAVYGWLVPFHIATHSYYHLPLMPLVAIGLASAAYVLRPLIANVGRLGRVVVLTALVVAVIYPLGITVWEASQCACQWRAAMYASLGKVLPEGRIVALTEAYGYPLMYYSDRPVDFWPTGRYRQVFALDGRSFARRFASETRGNDYFLVTDFAEFSRQPTLRHHLATHYPIVLQGEGFVLYDLRHPLR